MDWCLGVIPIQKGAFWGVAPFAITILNFAKRN